MSRLVDKLVVDFGGAVTRQQAMREFDLVPAESVPKTDLRALNEHLSEASRLLMTFPDRLELSREAALHLSEAHYQVCIAGCHLKPEDFR